jgi:hypothetical protein
VNHSSRVGLPRLRQLPRLRLPASSPKPATRPAVSSATSRSAASGSGEAKDDRKEVQDFGHEGDGFWFQGPGVAARNNIACGQGGTGFIFFTQGLKQDGLGTMRFPVANFADASWKGRISNRWQKDPDKIADADSVPGHPRPITGFRDNVVFACQNGITVASTPARRRLRRASSRRAPSGTARYGA